MRFYSYSKENYIILHIHSGLGISYFQRWRLNSKPCKFFLLIVYIYFHLLWWFRFPNCLLCMSSPELYHNPNSLELSLNSLELPTSITSKSSIKLFTLLPLYNHVNSPFTPPHFTKHVTSAMDGSIIGPKRAEAPYGVLKFI